ncbi:MAG: hypothetical protein ABIN48_02850 [Ginsengibacter sp.]
MKKYLLFLAVCLSVSTISFGQKYGTTKFSLGPEIGIATSNPFKNTNNKGFGIGAGASAQIEHFFQESISGVVSAGIVYYSGRSSGSTEKNKAYVAIPVLVGGNAFVGDRFHIGARIGAGLNSVSGISSTTFAYSPQIGYNFSRNEKPLDLTLKYDGYAGKYNFSALGLRLSFIL